MVTTKRRNGKIDLLKFIFAVIIMIHHSKNVVGSDVSLFLGGSFAVEFFFLVSGYLMMAGLNRLPSYEKGKIGSETLGFAFSKFKSFCPDLLISQLFALIFVAVAKGTDFINLFLNSFYETFLLHMFGLTVTRINPAIWYLSSMLLAMALLYPLVRKHPQTAVKLVIPLVSVLLLGYFCGNGTSPRNPTDWLGWTYRGNLRAIAEIGLGICLWHVTQHFKTIKFTRFGKILLTIIEYACYVSIINYMYTVAASRKDYFFLLIYAIALMISFSQQGIDAKIFDGKVFTFLGRFSFPLFLTHSTCSSFINYLLPQDFSNSQRLLIYYAYSILSAIAVMMISDLIRKHGGKISKAVSKCLIHAE